MLKELSNNPQDVLAEILAEDLVHVDRLIQQRMTSKNTSRILEVTSHLVNAGGKRIRPMLTMAAAMMCGYKGTFHVHLAATVEFIHTATLLHDDVVDESRQRRGKPTANLLWDNKSSVLVGDYLFSRAFQLMVETNSHRVLDILANASATIAEGEVLQLTTSRNIKTTEETYLQVVRGKTAALFSAAMEVGGVLASAPQNHVEALRKYGDSLGIAFQIVDDLLDVIGDSAQTGKNVGDDFRDRKLTLPFIKAIMKSTKKERAFWLRTFEKGDQVDGDLEMALELINSHDAIKETRQDALHWVERAQNALGSLPDHRIRDILYDLAIYVVKRLR